MSDNNAGLHKAAPLPEPFESLAELIRDGWHCGIFGCQGTIPYWFVELGYGESVMFEGEGRVVDEAISDALGKLHNAADDYLDMSQLKKGC